jgi:hypothetical protein
VFEDRECYRDAYHVLLFIIGQYRNGVLLSRSSNLHISVDIGQHGRGLRKASLSDFQLDLIPQLSRTPEAY